MRLEPGVVARSVAFPLHGRVVQVVAVQLGYFLGPPLPGFSTRDHSALIDTADVSGGIVAFNPSYVSTCRQFQFGLGRVVRGEASFKISFLSSFESIRIQKASVFNVSAPITVDTLSINFEHIAFQSINQLPGHLQAEAATIQGGAFGFGEKLRITANVQAGTFFLQLPARLPVNGAGTFSPATSDDPVRTWAASSGPPARRVNQLCPDSQSHGNQNFAGTSVCHS